MADAANTTPFSALAMSASAKNTTLLVSVLSDALIRIMQDIHGGTWRAVVDHDACFLMIRQNNEKAIKRPKSGEIA